MNTRCKFSLPARILVVYTFPSFIIALPTIPVYINLPTLYGVKLDLGLAAVGFALLGARIFDTISDPLVGLLSDRWGFRDARRKPWIAIGAVIAGYGLFKILNPPEEPDTTYLLIWSIVLYAGWTLVSVPYLAWGAELSTNYNERTRITAWREGFGLIGILAAGGIAALAPSLGLSEREGTESIAWLAIGMGIVIIPIMLWLVPEPVSRPSTISHPAARNTVKRLYTIFRNRLFLRLLCTWFLNGIANGIPAALFLIYLEHGLGASAEVQPLFIFVYFVTAILSIPLWLSASRHLGKHRVWCWAMLLASIAFITVPFMPIGSFVPFIGICIVTGMAFGADLCLPPSIQADVIDYDRWRFGEERAGLQFALSGMSTKLALAIAVGVSLPTLEMLGFDPDFPTRGGISSLIIIYACVPVVIKVLAISVIWKFPLNSAKQAAIRKRLDRQQ